MMPRSTIVILTVSTLSAACATRATTAGGPIVCINGLAVNGGSRAVLDVLMSDVKTRRWIDSFHPGSPGPLVLIDGREADGLGRLATLAAGEALDVEILDTDRATAEFGARGRTGALIVRTRAASTLNADPRLPEPGRCHDQHAA